MGKVLIAPVTSCQIDHHDILGVLVQIAYPACGILGLVSTAKLGDGFHCLPLEAVRLNGLTPPKGKASDDGHQDQQRAKPELEPAASGSYVWHARNCPSKQGRVNSRTLLALA